MKLKLRMRLFIFPLAIIFGAASVYAQSAGVEMRVKVAFPFSVGDKSFPAGDYRVTRQSSGMPMLTISTPDGKEKTTMQVLTRLAKDDHTSHMTGATLVFDQVDEQSYLSEVWMPGEDGYLVRGTTEEHKHRLVKASDKN